LPQKGQGRWGWLKVRTSSDAKRTSKDVKRARERPGKREERSQRNSGRTLYIPVKRLTRPRGKKELGEEINWVRFGNLPLAVEMTK